VTESKNHISVNIHKTQGTLLLLPPPTALLHTRKRSKERKARDVNKRTGRGKKKEAINKRRKIMARTEGSEGWARIERISKMRKNRKERGQQGNRRKERKVKERRRG
jgi:hypothetical protein